MSTEGTPPPVVNPPTTDGPEAAPEAPQGRVPTEAEIRWAQLQHTVANGASWFTWIAALTVVNAFLTSFNSPIGMAAGFFLTDAVVDGMRESGMVAVGIGIALVVAALYFGLGILAGRGARWAFILGILILTLDTVPVLPYAGQAIIGIAIHLWALWNMIGGVLAIGKLKKMSRGEAI